MPVASDDFFCRRCGYSLRALESNRCPECGREFDPDNARTMARRQPSRLKPRRTVAIVCLLGLLSVGYAAGYYKLIQVGPTVYPPQTAYGGNMKPYVIANPGYARLARYPRAESYRYDTPWVRWLFSPIHSIDRRIRPCVWTAFGCSEHFSPAANTVMRAYESNRPELRAGADALRDLIYQADNYRQGVPKWIEIDTLVSKHEAELRKQLPFSFR